MPQSSVLFLILLLFSFNQCVKDRAIAHGSYFLSALFSYLSTGVHNLHMLSQFNLPPYLLFFMSSCCLFINEGKQDLLCWGAWKEEKRNLCNSRVREQRVRFLLNFSSQLLPHWNLSQKPQRPGCMLSSVMCQHHYIRWSHKLVPHTYYSRSQAAGDPAPQVVRKQRKRNKGTSTVEKYFRFGLCQKLKLSLSF